MAKNQEKIALLIEKAKDKIMKENGYGTGYDHNREWICVRARQDERYDNDQDMELIMFQGTPAKGYIIVNYGTETVKAFGIRDKPLFTRKVDV